MPSIEDQCIQFAMDAIETYFHWPHTNYQFFYRGTDPGEVELGSHIVEIIPPDDIDDRYFIVYITNDIENVRLLRVRSKQYNIPAMNTHRAKCNELVREYIQFQLHSSADEYEIIYKGIAVNNPEHEAGYIVDANHEDDLDDRYFLVLGNKSGKSKTFLIDQGKTRIIRVYDRA